MHWMILPFRRYATFDGRSGRSEFWLFVLLLLIIAVIASAIDDQLGYVQRQVWDWGNGVLVTVQQTGGPATAVAFLATIVPLLAVSVRRLHDTDKSGWWLLLHLIPFAGSLVLLIFFIGTSTRGPNRFGTDPLGEVSEPTGPRWSDGPPQG